LAARRVFRHSPPRSAPRLGRESLPPRQSPHPPGNRRCKAVARLSNLHRSFHADALRARVSANVRPLKWFYCLAGEYVVEIGDQRFRLGPGDSVRGPRRVPHAFVSDSAGPAS